MGLINLCNDNQEVKIEVLNLKQQKKWETNSGVVSEVKDKSRSVFDNDKRSTHFNKLLSVGPHASPFEKSISH